MAQDMTAGRQTTWRYEVNWTSVFVLAAFLLGVLVGSR